MGINMSLLKEFKNGVDACNVSEFLLAICLESNIAIELLDKPWFDGPPNPDDIAELWDTAEDRILDLLAKGPFPRHGSITAEQAISLFNETKEKLE